MDGLGVGKYEKVVFHLHLVVNIDVWMSGFLGSGRAALVKDERGSTISAVYLRQGHILRYNDDLREVIMPPQYLLCFISLNSKSFRSSVVQKGHPTVSLNAHFSPCKI